MAAPTETGGRFADGGPWRSSLDRGGGSPSTCRPRSSGRRRSSRACGRMVVRARKAARVTSDPPPALKLDQPGLDRHEDRAGEAGHQRDGGERPGALTLEPGGDDGEGRLVEHRRHDHADQRPDDVELDQGRDLGERQQQERRGDRAGRHDAALGRARRASGRPARRKTGEQHREREGAGLLPTGPAAIDLQDGQEDGEAVVEDAPGDGLGDPEHDHQPPAVEEAAWPGPAGRRCWRLAGCPPVVAAPRMVGARTSSRGSVAQEIEVVNLSGPGAGGAGRAVGTMSVPGGKEADRWSWWAPRDCGRSSVTSCWQSGCGRRRPR